MRRLGAPPLWDLGLAAALAVAAVGEVWVPLPSVMGDGSRVLSTAVALVACLALAWRRSAPLLVALLVLLGWPIAYSLTPVLVLFNGQFVPIVVALYSVARHGTARQRLLGALSGAGTLLYMDLRVPELGDASEIVFHWMVCTIAFGLGYFVHSYEERAFSEAVRAARAESRSREQALQAVADERARIARELHDIVAHSVSVMVVQAGAAEKALDDPEYVRKALGAIRTTGSSALTEMRRVVALIRDTEEPTDLQPQPDEADIEKLVAAMEVPTTLRVEGEPQPLPAGVALSTFRIVQEALTNVRRHSEARSVEVTLRYLADRVEIEVVDDGVGTSAPAGGNGLIGMRERAQMYGGSVAATTSPGEG
ncbi:MAG: sensor histidine kinase, partial [Marmoricola sp.]